MPSGFDEHDNQHSKETGIVAATFQNTREDTGGYHNNRCQREDRIGYFVLNAEDTISSAEAITKLKATQKKLVSQIPGAELRLSNLIPSAGSTLVAAYIDADKVVIANTGDSAAFWVTPDNNQALQLIPLTWEHTPHDHQEAVRINQSDDGQVNEKDKRVHHKSERLRTGSYGLTRALGKQNLKSQGVIDTPDFTTFPHNHEGQLLLVSDGVTHELSHAEIVNVLSSHSFENWPQALKDAIWKKELANPHADKAHDNIPMDLDDISVVAIDVAQVTKPSIAFVADGNCGNKTSEHIFQNFEKVANDIFSSEEELNAAEQALNEEEQKELLIKAILNTYKVAFHYVLGGCNERSIEKLTLLEQAIRQKSLSLPELEATLKKKNITKMHTWINDIVSIEEDYTSTVEFINNHKQILNKDELVTEISNLKNELTENSNEAGTIAKIKQDIEYYHDTCQMIHDGYDKSANFDTKLQKIDSYYQKWHLAPKKSVIATHAKLATEKDKLLQHPQNKITQPSKAWPIGKSIAFGILIGVTVATVVAVSGPSGGLLVAGLVAAGIVGVVSSIVSYVSFFKPRHENKVIADAVTQGVNWRPS